MLRYYIIATVIVVTFVAIVVSVQRGSRELNVASVKTTASPSPPRAQGQSTAPPRPVRGDAPWAMTGVPECFHELEQAHGPLDFVRAALPAGSAVLPPGRVLTVGDCVVAVKERTVEVWRGGDVLRVPPVATLYALPNGDLALLRREGRSAVLRIYGPGFDVHGGLVAEPSASPDK